MATTQIHTGRSTSRIAALAGSTISAILLLLSVYFVAVLGSQIMLVLQGGVWAGSACALHAAINGTPSCFAYVSDLAVLGGPIRYLTTQADALTVLFGLIVVFAALRALVAFASARAIGRSADRPLQPAVAWKA
ncbi:hypothetical protein [Methylobacterium oryzisoli]|uniref:hypothetical protein n=1 Tax=Methylobacterium oryzisoli TaxID=3385502 RepID=UPI00389240BD